MKKWGTGDTLARGLRQASELVSDNFTAYTLKRFLVATEPSRGSLN